MDFRLHRSAPLYLHDLQIPYIGLAYKKSIRPRDLQKVRTLPKKRPRRPYLNHRLPLLHHVLVQNVPRME
jgi:hypothetical protein